jgi:hypothetical protein
MLIAMAVLTAGLLGVAAAVYVGVDQTRSSLDDSTAAAVARQAAATLGQVMTRDNTAECADGKFRRFIDSGVPTPGALQSAVAGSQICTTDPRYAWIPLYRRDPDSAVAQVVIVVVRAQTKETFDARDFAVFNGAYAPTLVPTPATAFGISVVDNTLAIDLPGGPERLGPGTLVLLNGERLAGRLVRLGHRNDDGTWALDPGQDLSDDIAPFKEMARQNPDMEGKYDWKIDGYVIGRGYADVTRPADGFAGTSQAVAAYSTMVMLR